jgi:hypothetical protein
MGRYAATSPETPHLGRQIVELPSDHNDNEAQLPQRHDHRLLQGLLIGLREQIEHVADGAVRRADQRDMIK